MSGTVARPKIPNTAPCAIETMFGWVLAGACGAQNDVGVSNCMLLTTSSPNSSPWSKLEGLVQNFWEQEAVGLIDKTQSFTHDERDAVEQFNESVTFNGERYVVGLPFKRDAPELMSNYNEAFSRLLTTERSLKKNPEKKEAYTTAINEYVENGFARELTNSELDEIDSCKRYYIPHHPIFKMTSASTKVRIVFDASAKAPNGWSLNDCLLKGPNLLPDIAAVLLRFHMNPIALNGDLRKMFCQTAVAAEFRPYQLYLWRNCDTMSEPKVYAMQRLMFGVTSSPFLAVQCVLHHANSSDVVTKHGSIVYDLLRRNMYMDDVHIGGTSVEDVIAQQRMVVDFFNSGGWSIVKFASNSPEVMAAIPKEFRHPSMVLDLDENEFGEASSLGLKWDTTVDVLYCKASDKLLKPDKVVTKRSILSKVSRIFDVFGFLAGFTIRAKILLQQLWKLKLNWNEPLNNDCAVKYTEWVAELADLETVKIPRCPFYLHQTAVSVQIHGFCDASLDAYAAIVYLRIEYSPNDVQVAYLMAKTRVAPLKGATIPRLELMAAHSLAKLTQYVISSLNEVMTVDSVHLWSDSKVVLSWIAKPSNTWKIFVRNRVQDIHDLFSSEVWRHCPGPENPADLHSRGIKLLDLRDNDLYWHGPEWLILDESCWPSKESCNELVSTELDELKKEGAKTAASMAIVHSRLSEIDTGIFERFSSYPKTVRLIARILRWRYCAQHPRRFATTCIGPEEYELAETFIFRLVQMTNFCDDYFELQATGIPRRNCCFKDMDPRNDRDRELIVCGDRLAFSALPDSQKSPIILPAKNGLVEKLILHVHSRNCHAPQDTTIAILRERFHIIHIRESVRRALKNCVTCRHYSSQVSQQKMGVLPLERVTPAPAFTDIGLDFTGPVYIKNEETGKMRKAYICIFTCTHSRMVHFELTNNMSTEEFLAALRRTINRRGWCKKIISDNQLTFKKAEKLVQLSIANDLGKDLHDESVQSFLAENGITWVYITERSPHRGAFYERLNRSLKEPLRKILGKARLNYTELYTILTDIEAALNQRPLTYLGSDPRNPQAITPSHLAIGRALKTVPNIPDDPRISVSKRYKHLQMLLKHFWKRWCKEYLPTLAKHHKWQSECSVPKIGDVCLISEDNVTRPNWPLARAIEAIPSKDGLVRTFKLRTKAGVLTRPVQKLHLIEKCDDVNDTPIDANDIDPDVNNLPELESGPEQISYVDRQISTDIEQSCRGGQDVPASRRIGTTRRGRKIRVPVRYLD